MNVPKPSRVQRNILVGVVILAVTIVAFGAVAYHKPSSSASPITVTAVQTATVVQTVSVVQTSTTGMITTSIITTKVTSATTSTETATVGT